MSLLRRAPIRSSLAIALIALPAFAFAADSDGQSVYESVCIACHGSGVDNAPRFGDQRQWKPLIREGLNELVPAALRGIRKMPPKGGKPELSDEAVARAVIYMANAGGARFTDPGPEDVARWRKKADARRK